MRTSVLSAFLLGTITVLFPLFALAKDTLPAAGDGQFEPKSYMREHTKKRIVSKPKLKPVPLEVKRIQAKMQSHAVVKHRPAHHHPHPPLFRCPEHHHRHLSVRKSVSIPKHNVLFASLKRHHRLAHCVMYPGSLKANIERIAGEYGWYHVVWTLSEDYRWVGKTRVVAQGLSSILGKVLKNYPLQAEFYKGNHVLVIIPRTIQ